VSLLPKFYRFEMQTISLMTGVPEGVFVRAHEVLHNESGEIPGYHQENMETCIDWFRKNLKKPTKFNASTSKGAYRRETKGVSWFKDTAFEHIAKIRDVIAILEDCGYAVNERSTTKPGYIVYEDDYQIVAEPFND
jgi:hypothetical protein